MVGDGVQALINASSQGSNLVFLCIIITCLVLGVDLIGKLYKNNLTVGVSRTEFFLAKAFVVACIALLQLIISLVIAFIPATILNGFGTMPDGFIGNLLTTIFLQFLCLLAWLSIVSFILYVSHSYLAVFIGYFGQLYLTFYANAHLPKYQNFAIFIIAVFLCYD